MVGLSLEINREWDKRIFLKTVNRLSHGMMIDETSDLNFNSVVIL